MKYLQTILFITFLSVTHIYFSQTRKIDSLLKIIQTSSEKEKPELYNKIAATFRQNDPVKNIEYATKALDIAEKTGNEKEKGYALSNIGHAYYIKGEYYKAIEYINIATIIGEKLSDEKLLGSCHNTMGLLYQNEGEMGKSIDNFLLALKYRTAVHDTNAIAASTNNLAESYRLFGNLDVALVKLKEAETLYKKANSINGLGAVYSNMGAVFTEKFLADTLAFNLLDSSSNYFNKAIEVCKKIGNIRGLAIALNNLGLTYTGRKLPLKALECIKEATEISARLGDPVIYITNLTSLATAYADANNFTEAEKTITLSTDSAGKLGLKLQLSSAENNFAAILHKMGRDKEAYNHLAKATELRAQIFNQETSDKITNLQIEIDKQKRESEILLEEESSKRQKIVLILSIIFLVIIALFILNRYRIKHKAHGLLEAQNKIIAEKNKEILDSIRYAKRIQNSLLPTEKFIERILKKDRKDGI